MINVGSKLRQETFEVDRKYIAFCPLMLIRRARQCNISEQGKSELHLNFTWHGNVGSVQSHSQTFNNFYPSSQEKTVFLKTNREHWNWSELVLVTWSRDPSTIVWSLWMRSRARNEPSSKMSQSRKRPSPGTFTFKTLLRHYSKQVLTLSRCEIGLPMLISNIIRGGQGG